MSLGSKLNIEYKGMFLFALFYLAAGILNIIILGVYGLGLFHVALVAVLSLVTALGLYRLQTWSLWLVVALFFIATTYGAFMINASVASYAATAEVSSLLAIVVWSAYLLLTFIATIYVAAKRRYLR
jgi:hypothetical protein